ncbi:MAG: hypothetical protein V9H69_18150 [Anaerolineae bacterium]
MASADSSRSTASSSRWLDGQGLAHLGHQALGIALHLLDLRAALLQDLLQSQRVQLPVGPGVGKRLALAQELQPVRAAVGLAEDQRLRA